MVLVSSSPLAQSASYWAQGGLAAALDPDDSVDLHLGRHGGRGARRDQPEMAEILCAEAPERVRELERLGISFDRSAGGELLLSLEGGHTRRRVAHAGGSATGRHVTARLSELVTSEDRIEVHERTSACTVGRGRPLRRRRYRVGGDPGRRDGARDRRRRGALAADHQPARGDRLRA